MSTKNLSRRETNYLSKGEINSEIRTFYQQLIRQETFPEELKPYWDLLKGLLISSKAVTTEATDELLTYILAIGEISAYDRADAM